MLKKRITVDLLVEPLPKHKGLVSKETVVLRRRRGGGGVKLNNWFQSKGSAQHVTSVRLESLFGGQNTTELSAQLVKPAIHYQNIQGMSIIHFV